MIGIIKKIYNIYNEMFKTKGNQSKTNEICNLYLIKTCKTYPSSIIISDFII